MAFSNVIKVLEECRIFPAHCPFSRMSIPLSLFDMAWIPLPPVQRLIFYQLDCSKTRFMDTILPHLKTSLSLTLSHFFPMAGNLTWPLDSCQPEILYVEGDSVSLTVCESDDDFCQLVSNQVRNANQVFHPFIPQLFNMSTKNKHFPVLALRVTLFPNKGICVGIAFHHTVVDGNAFFQFLKSWACVSRSEGDTSFLAKTPLCYDRSIVKDPKGIGMKLLEEVEKFSNFTKETFDLPRSNHHATPTGQKVLSTFLLRLSEIKRLKSWLNEEKGMGGLSTYVITSACVWVCWIKAQRGEDVTDDDDGMEGLLTPVDCRERVDPPLPQTYFGNCLLSAVAKVKTSDLVGKDGIMIAAEAIRNSIKTPTEGNEQIMEHMESGLSLFSSFSPGRLLFVAGSPRFGIYDIDFGWGSPKISQVISSIISGGTIFSQCPTEPGAVQISLALDPTKMEAFASFFANTILDIP